MAFSFHRWLMGFKGQQNARKRQPIRRRSTAQLGLEALEDRRTPASLATHLTGTANPFNGINVGGSSRPALGDVDGDGDLDALMGESDGTLLYFKNTGSATSPAYTQQTGTANPFDSIDVGLYSAPELGDVDGDGDLDALVGAQDGTLLYFKNTGSATSPLYAQQTGTANPFNGIDVGNYSAPELWNVDGDGDLDALMGASDGTLRYFKNTGTATGPLYAQQTGTANPFNGIDVGDFSTPALGDVNGDGDLDAIVGLGDGTLRYFQNTGTATSPAYAQQTGTANLFNGISVGLHSTPALGDVDGDGDLDALVGEASGTLLYFRANRAPVVVNAIPDQIFTGPGSHSYTVPANTFLDLDNNALTYSATLAGDSPLPAWLTFDPATRTFSGNPTVADATPLQVRVIASDGQGGSISDDFQLALSNVSDLPTLVVPGAQAAFEDVDKAITGITVNDPDGGSLTVTLAVGHGKLKLGTTTGLTVSGNRTGSVSLSGTSADLNASLAGLVYRGGLNYSGADMLSITASDGSLSSSSDVAITVKSAAQQAIDLQALVNSLHAAGVLTAGQRDSLIAKLSLKGRTSDVYKVQRFLSQVTGLRQTGILTKAEAGALQDLGNILLLSVTRQ